MVQVHKKRLHVLKCTCTFRFYLSLWGKHMYLYVHIFAVLCLRTVFKTYFSHDHKMKSYMSSNIPHITPTLLQRVVKLISKSVPDSFVGQIIHHIVHSLQRRPEIYVHKVTE